MDLTKKYQIKKYKEDKIICFNDDVIVETYFYIYQGEKILARLMCSPSNLEYLVIGHLYALDLINSKDDIKDLQIRDNKAYVKLKEEKSPKIKRNKGKFILEREKIFALANEFQNYSLIFKKTGGAHACAIIENYRIMEFFEDVKEIGRDLVKEFESDDMLDELEKQMDLNKNQIIDLFDGIEKNPFMLKRIGTYLSNTLAF